MLICCKVGNNHYVWLFSFFRFLFCCHECNLVGCYATDWKKKQQKQKPWNIPQKKKKRSIPTMFCLSVHCIWLWATSLSPCFSRLKKLNVWYVTRMGNYNYSDCSTWMKCADVVNSRVKIWDRHKYPETSFYFLFVCMTYSLATHNEEADRCKGT